MDITKEFGKNIRNFRLKKKLSQEELADIADLHRTYIGAIERGEKNITLKNIIKITKALNIKPSDLFREMKL